MTARSFNEIERGCMMYQRQKRANNLYDMIVGELNRMMVTHDRAELDTMAQHAQENIKRLQVIRIEQEDNK